LATSFELEADRMVNLSLPAEEFKKEIEVVKEERRLRTEDNPQSLTVETARATAFQVSPYRNPIIGWMSDLENMRVDDLRNWYERWYTPTNATVVVVGDVSPSAVHEMAERYFGALSARAKGAQKPVIEPTQRGTRRAWLIASAQVPFVVIDFKAPSLTTSRNTGASKSQAEAYALELLAALLGGDESARLPSRLVRSRNLAAEIETGYDLYARLDTLFSVFAVPTEGHSSEEIETALLAELDVLKTQPPTEQELDRVKRRLISARTFEQDSPFYRAMQIGILETVGLGWRVREEYVGAIERTTPAALQAVAEKFLLPERMTITTLIPEQAAP